MMLWSPAAWFRTTGAGLLVVAGVAAAFAQAPVTSDPPNTLPPLSGPPVDVPTLGAPAPPQGRSGWLEALRARGVAIVSCFASVVPNKGHACLLRAVAELNRRGWAHRVAVLCVGDLPAGYEEHVEEMQALAAELGVDNLTFAGWQDDPATFYQYTDVAVLEVSEPMQLVELALDPRIRRFLLARLSDTVALVDPGRESELTRALLAAGHTPKMVEGLVS